MTRYLFITVGDVEPEIKGPFDTEKARDDAALAHKREAGDEDGIFMLDIDEDGVPSTEAYSGGFFDEEDE